MPLLLAKGILIDGTGSPAQSAEVLVEDERIRAIGPIPEPGEAEVLDCSGLVVAPGFVDVHSHSETNTSGPMPASTLPTWRWRAATPMRPPWRVTTPSSPSTRARPICAWCSRTR